MVERETVRHRSLTLASLVKNLASLDKAELQFKAQRRSDFLEQVEPGHDPAAFQPGDGGLLRANAFRQLRLAEVVLLAQLAHLPRDGKFAELFMEEGRESRALRLPALYKFSEASADVGIRLLAGHVMSPATRQCPGMVGVGRAQSASRTSFIRKCASSVSFVRALRPCFLQAWSNTITGPLART